MLFKGFKHLNIHLILVQNFSNFFVSVNRAVKIFYNFLKIIHFIIFPIFIFHAIWDLSKSKCLSNISPKISKRFFKPL